MSSRGEPSLWRLLNAGVAVDDLRTSVINKLTGSAVTGAGAAVIHHNFSRCQHKLNSDYTITGWDWEASVLQINGIQALAWTSDTVGLALGIDWQGSTPADAYDNHNRDLVVEADRAARNAFLSQLSTYQRFRDYVRGRYVDLGFYSEERGLALAAVHCFNEEFKRGGKFNWVGQRVAVVRRFLSGGRSGELDGADRQLLSEYVRCGMTLILAVRICLADADGKLEEVRQQCNRERIKAVKDNSNLWSKHYTNMHNELESTIAKVKAVEADLAALREDFKKEVEAMRESVTAVQAGVAGVTEGLEACERSVGGCLEESRRGVEDLARKRAEDEKRWGREFARIHGQAGIDGKNVGLLAESVTENLGKFRRQLEAMMEFSGVPTVPPHQQREQIEDAVERQVRQYFEKVAFPELLASKDAQLSKAAERIRELEAILNIKRRRTIDLSGR